MKQEHGEQGGAHEAAEAAHGGGHASTGAPHINLWSWDQHAPPVGWYAVNFVIFVVFLVKAARKPLAAAMQRRHDSIKATIEENQKAYDAAKERHDTYRNKLANVDAESRDLIDRSKEDGALERDRIISSAREYAKRLREDAQTVIEQEEERARRRLQTDVAKAALKSAEDMLRRGLTDADRDRLFEQSLQMIESSDAHIAPRRSSNDRKSATVADGAA